MAVAPEHQLEGKYWRRRQRDKQTIVRRPGKRNRSGRSARDPVGYTVEPLPEEGEKPRVVEPAVPPDRVPYEFDEGRIDSDAAKVVTRLVRNGYEAYLVGGCVRDLLLGHTPKDFDVATNARPDVVRDLFRNCRIIGRRFRLAHVLFGAGKVIETATFRRQPREGDQEEGDLLIRDDNAFGQAHEDAARRDFTINALFYDLEERAVLDWCHGMDDIAKRAVRTIGDPVVRFKEDPVRMLRAIKFSARLDLGIEPETYNAIVQCRGTLAMAARPRLFEEILRLLRGGAAHRSMWLAWETGLLDVLLPELSSYLYDAPTEDRRVWALLDQLDAYRAEQGQPADDVVLLCCLLLEPMREACEGKRDRVTSGYDFLEPIVERLAIPRRIADAVRRIVAVLPRLESERPGKFSRTPLYPLAAQVLEYSSAASPNEERLFPDMPARRRKKRARRKTSPKEAS